MHTAGGPLRDQTLSPMRACTCAMHARLPAVHELAAWPVTENMAPSMHCCALHASGIGNGGLGYKGLGKRGLGMKGPLTSDDLTCTMLPESTCVAALTMNRHLKAWAAQRVCSSDSVQQGAPVRMLEGSDLVKMVCTGPLSTVNSGAAALASPNSFV